MQKKWRLIKTIETNGARQMAIDESIARARVKNLIPNTIRFYGWKPSCITLGIFQHLEAEVDVDECKTKGVDIVRRYTGGGAVYHDKELTYSIVLKEEDSHENIIKSYEQICGALVRGFFKLGLKAHFKPINDICIGERKISGNAQTRIDGVILQHGTILLDVDVDRMFSLLKVPDEKIRDKIISNVKERVTSLQGRIEFEDVRKVMIEGFEEEFNIKLEEGELTEFERKEASKLEREKYANEGWTRNGNRP